MAVAVSQGAATFRRPLVVAKRLDPERSAVVAGPTSALPLAKPTLPAAVATDEPAEPKEFFQRFWQENISFFTSGGVHFVGLVIAALLYPSLALPPAAIAIVSAPATEVEELREIEEVAIEQLETLEEVESTSVVSDPSVAASDVQSLALNPVADSGPDGGMPLEAADFAEEIAPAADILSFVPAGGSRGQGGSGRGRGNGQGGVGGDDLALFSRRLQREGAKTGDVQVSLAWNNFNDIDLHVITPNGDHIFFNQRFSRCRGLLDVDMNAGGRQSREPVENVFWARGGAPMGKYQVYVHHFARQGDPDPTLYKVLINVDGELQAFSGTLSFGGAPVKVCEFERKPAPPPPSANDPFPL